MTDPATELDETELERRYRRVETKLDGSRARTAAKGPVTLIAVLLGLCLAVGATAVVDLRRLQDPRGTALAWAGAALFGDCTGYRELSRPDPASPPDVRPVDELCAELRRATQSNRDESGSIGIDAGEVRTEDAVALVVVEVRRSGEPRRAEVRLERRDDGRWLVVRDEDACRLVDCP